MWNFRTTLSLSELMNPFNTDNKSVKAKIKMIYCNFILRKNVVLIYSDPAAFLKKSIISENQRLGLGVCAKRMKEAKRLLSNIILLSQFVQSESCNK